MNLHEDKFKSYAVVKEMLETAAVIKNFDVNKGEKFSEKIKSCKNIFLTGEGSSRIFPAKRAIEFSMKNNLQVNMQTDGATQALEYNLSNYVVFGASNSGKTKEAVRLFKKLKDNNHKLLFSVIANAGTPMQELADECIVLSCGKEDAVAATKSVIEQALVYDIIFRKAYNLPMPDLNELSEKIRETLEADIPEEIIEPLKNAKTLYFAGRNNGVAEELTLKTNEITRKKSAYLEGTYAVHGIEEIMDKDEAVIIINPFVSEEEKFRSCLNEKIGIPIISVTPGTSLFPAVKIPSMPGFNEYIQLAAGWNLLINIGISLGINLDKPIRARKIGNEFIE